MRGCTTPPLEVRMRRARSCSCASRARSPSVVDQLAVEAVKRVEQRAAPRAAGAAANRRQSLFGERGEHDADERVACSEPAVHRRPREAELLRDRLHVHAFAGEEALGAQRERILTAGGGRTAGTACGERGHFTERKRAQPRRSTGAHRPAQTSPDRTAVTADLRQNLDKEPDMAYSVPPLPYAYDALEPHIDKATMEFHHDKHHQAYVDKANAALEGTALGRRADRGGAAEPRPGARGQARGGQKQRRRPLQPHAVLGEHDPGRRRRAVRRARERDRRGVRLLRGLPGQAQGNRRQPVRLRLVVARARRLGLAIVGTRQPGQPDLRRQDARCSASTCGSTPTT